MTAKATLPIVLGKGIHSARPAASDVGSGGLYSCTTHSLVYQTDGSSWTTWATLGGGGGGVTATTAVATSDTSVGANSWTDVTGLSLSCADGTYVFFAMLSLINTASATAVMLRITDGSTHHAAAEHDVTTAGFQNEVNAHTGPVVLTGGPTTIKVQAFITASGGTAKATGAGSTGNIFSRLTAMKIA